MVRCVAESNVGDVVIVDALGHLEDGGLKNREADRTSETRFGLTRMDDLRFHAVGAIGRLCYRGC